MVEYGPVELGGKRYFCPVRSISVSRAPGEVERIAPEHRRVLSMDQATTTDEAGVAAPLQTLLNETTFDNYHLFRADAQILTAGNAKGELAPAAPPTTSPEGPASAAPAPATTQLNAAPAEPAAAPAPSAASTVAEGETPNPVPTESTAAPPAASLPAAASASPSPASSAAEMAVVAPAPFPEKTGPLPAASGFALKINTRLVDVDVTAFDQKGHPVTGLTMKDFEIYDNGRRQTPRSLSRVSGAASPLAQGSAATVQGAVYSNRPEALGSPAVQPAQAEALASSTILLLDESSVGFLDLNYARQQVLKFLDRLPESQPVALYLRTGPGFRILAEETTDHAALSSVLRKWVPTAPDLQRAQEEETRTRQSFDYVDFPDELQYVNGNMGGMEAPTSDPLSTAMVNYGGNTTPDPKLSKEGQTPQRDALAALIGVAANLNAIPGHKNLVWVASDNVLANWSDQAPGNERGPNTIDAFNLGIEEALNDAHVSLYPLDVSQLEATATDASLQADAVGLNPAFINETCGGAFRADRWARNSRDAAGHARGSACHPAPGGGHRRPVVPAVGQRAWRARQRSCGWRCRLPAQLLARYPAGRQVSPDHRHCLRATRY